MSTFTGPTIPLGSTLQRYQSAIKSLSTAGAPSTLPKASRTAAAAGRAAGSGFLVGTPGVGRSVGGVRHTQGVLDGALVAALQAAMRVEPLVAVRCPAATVQILHGKCGSTGRRGARQGKHDLLCSIGKI